MILFKEYKRWDKIYLYVVENEERKAELGSTFIVYPSLTIRVADKAHDDIYLLHSTGHDDSYSVTSFPLLG